MTDAPLTAPDIPPPSGTLAIPDLAYGPHERQQIDLYLPPGTPRGVIGYIHGGSWAKLDRKMVRAWRQLDHGYAIASLGYRLSQQAPFPAQIADINGGLALLARIAPEHGLELTKLALMGLSAGGHLAALAALARDVPGFGSPPEVKIRAVVDYYGPSNLITLAGTGVLNPAVAQLLGHPMIDDPRAAYRASPVAYCTADAPPFLLIHGDADAVVPITESYNLQAQLLNAGSSAEVIHIAGGGHATADMHTPAIHDRINAFLDRHLEG